jgi:hypothetical protein
MVAGLPRRFDQMGARSHLETDGDTRSQVGGG